MTAVLADVGSWSLAPTCEFGICRREAEHQVMAERADGSLERVLRVCGLHVTPAITWGLPAPLEVAIRPV